MENWKPQIPRFTVEAMKFFRECVAEINKRTPKAGIGTSVSESGGGVTINAEGGTGAAGGSGGRVPLEPHNTSTTVGETTTLKVSIEYGTIAGLELDSYGPVTITASRWFYGKLTWDEDGEPDTLVLHHLGTATAPTNTFDDFYIYLGRAVVASGEITEINRNLAGSQQAERCGYEDDYSHNHWLV